ncbi:hypothetical protein AZE42_11742 [Rhizopogon vesiculosus]|uniref:Uncharacterized protein n=1 Tax=Rhizopogon vesiculosus TaxID=180088 RepID=A0A1J8PMV0_9AGAM|nr:hypothetical protein AZE42_11742 [Rhizopogon vesiculosus]
MRSSPPNTVAREIGELSEAPSVKWIFETSTDPEVISSVAWLLPTVKWTSELHMQTLSVSARQRALACGRALHHVVCDETIQKFNPSNDNDQHFDWDSLELWSAWHDIALPWGLDACRTSFDQYATTLDRNHEKQARIALRLAIIWHGNGGDTQSPPPDTVTRELVELSEAPSVKWIFETSTDPEVISSVAWLLPTVKWTRELHMPTVSLRLLSTFKACFRAGFRLSVSARQRALACGRALHHVVCDETIQELNPPNDNDKRFDLDSLENIF